MRLDSVTAEIRPRSDWEAVDLGFALVRRNFWRNITVWWLAVGIPTAIAGVWWWDRPLLLLALFWWLRPAGSRMVLFGLSRRLFGEVPSWRATFLEIPRAWTRRFFYRFFVARLSPWLPVTLAVEDLEGLRGKAYRQRGRQVVRRGEGVVMWLYFISDTASVWLGLSVLALVMMLIPDGQDAPWQHAIESWDPAFPFEIPLLITRTVAVCMMIGISLTDAFVTGAGFGIYLNNRTWIEGWDVELAFRRMAQRLARAAVVVMLFLVLGAPAYGRAEPDAAQLIREVKADPVFKVHTVIEKIPKPTPKKTVELPNGLTELFRFLVVGAMVSVVAFLGWLVWKNRHVFLLSKVSKGNELAERRARVVMGMEVSPHTLPSDIQAVAWELWSQGRHQEAVGLLYRGAISRVIESGKVELQESDTEGECLRRVNEAGVLAHPKYFANLTDAWILLAYAGIRPGDADVGRLCGEWPFEEGRRA